MAEQPAEVPEKLIYRLVVEVDEDTVLAIEKLKTHLSNRFPKGASKSQIVAWAVSQMVAQIDRAEAKKESKKLRPNQAEKIQKIAAAPATTEIPLNAEAKKHSRYIPAHVERSVRTRAQGTCEYMNPTQGQRCQSQWNLHIHHLKPFACGGSSEDVENLALYCAAHNQMQAWLDFPGQIRASI